jgi:hypothetical protein
MDTKQPNYYSATHEEINGYEYLMFKLNSSDRKYVEMWGEDMTKYFHSQHKKGKDISIHLLDTTDMHYKLNNLHAINALQIMSIGEELGFKQIVIFVVLPPGRKSKLIAMAINSVTNIITTFSGDKYKYRCEFVNDVNEGRRKIMETIEGLSDN